MGQFTRGELEEAFAAYQGRRRAAGATGDWSAWADQFTEDAAYIEHHYGTLRGPGGDPGLDHRRRWARSPATACRSSPIEWYVIDEERGWIVCQVWNRMADPGDGSVHQGVQHHDPEVRR